MMHPRHLVTVGLLLAAGCATTGETATTLDRPNFALQEFQLLQGVFRTQYSGKHVFDFPNDGRVTVREISLDGFPGNTYVRCRFHYQNRTTRPVMQTWVSLDVLDADGRVAETRSCHLVMPTSTAIDRGSYYSDEVRTPTRDAHLKPGWSWRIRCQSDHLQADEPLDPPVPEWQPRDSGPIRIKDWSWPYYQAWMQYPQAWSLWNQDQPRW